MPKLNSLNRYNFTPRERLPATESNRTFSASVLALLFLISFAVPLVAAIKVSHLEWFHNFIERGTEESLFKDPFPVTSPNQYLHLVAKEGLNPTKGSDMLISVWLRFSELPKEGTITLLSKVDTKGRFKSGYSLVLSADSGTYRPMIYWKDDFGKGRILPFAELSIPLNVWCMFAISFRDDSALGLHFAKRESNGKVDVQLLGGYKFGATVIPHSIAPLRVGSIKENNFRGAVGAIGIFSGQKLSGELRKTIKSLAKDPLHPLGAFSTEAINVWVLGDKVQMEKSKVRVRRFPS